MYSRSFYPSEQRRPAFPENYDGTAFSEPPSLSNEPPQETINFIPEPEAEPAASESVFTKPCVSSATAGVKIPLLSDIFGGSGGIFSSGENFLSKIGVEEILIIAVAAFLLFSKDGDIECALMLLLLLFID